MLYDGYSESEPELVDDVYESTGEVVVFCKDCVHYHRTVGMVLSQIEARCMYTFKPSVNLVSGHVSKPHHTDMNKCSTMRGKGSGCGHVGKWWKPRKESKEMTMLLLKRKVEE